MKRWEHKRVLKKIYSSPHPGVDSWDSNMPHVNELGKQGWEIVGEDELWWTLKRELPVQT